MFMFGYYNEFEFVRRQITCQIFLDTIDTIIIFITNQSTLDDHDIGHLLNFHVLFQL